MLVLVAGLILFIGIHSVRIVAPGFRQSRMDLWGEEKYKRMYTLISVVGLLLIVVGYARSRYVPTLLWNPAHSMHYVTGLLTLLSFMLFASSSVPNNRVKQWVKHPMSLAVVVWSFAHLLSNARIGDLLLFGSFFIWSLLAFMAAHKRGERSTETSVEGAGNIGRVIIGGTVVWAVFGLLLHRYLIGVHPFGWF